MNLDTLSNQIYIVAVNEAKLQRHEYITPEHFLYATLMFDLGKKIIAESGGNVAGIINDLQEFFINNVEKTKDEEPIESYSFVQMFEMAAKKAYNSSKDEITLGNLLVTIQSLNESYASYIMEKNHVKKLELLRFVSHDVNSDISSLNIEDKSKEEDFLKKFTQNLTEKAKKGKLDPLVGREDIIERTVQTLCRRLKNNPVHVGNPGVGKTSIIEGLAQLIVNEEVPKKLIGAEIFYIDMGSVVAGTKYRGDFEDRLLKILTIISKKNKPIVYLDEIHTTVGAGSVSGGGMDATSIIKPYLSAGDIRFIGSTTFDEYKKYFEKDRALSRRFQRIDVNEPSIFESIEILKGIKSKYEEYHGVIYKDEIIQLICELSSKYLNDRYMPDKAIDILDETGAFLSMKSKSDAKIIVTAKDVERTISMIAKVPTNSISSKDISKLKNLEKNLKSKIYGQDKAVKEVSDAIKLSRAGLKEEYKPVASMLFVGPTGVGKTEIAKQLSNQLGVNLIRYDMSEYQEKHAIAKLIGSPPGYVGYEEGGKLIEDIVKTPHAVLLLDEIEKAHPDIFNVLLQVMDYGSLTDSTGKKADFKDIIIIMTSNAGARSVGKRVIGFDEKTLNNGEIDREVEKIFSPEFRNRLDNIITFNAIDEKMAISITKKALGELKLKLKPKNVILKEKPKLIKYIASKGLSETYGAREILRVVNNDVKKVLVENILFGELKDGGTAVLDFINDKIVLNIEI